MKTRLFSSKGSALIIAVIFTAALALVLAGVASYVGTVQRLQLRAETLVQARYAAESAVNQALGEIVTEFGAFVNREGLAVDIPRTHFAREGMQPINFATMNWMPQDRTLDADRSKASKMTAGRMIPASVDAIQIVPGVLSVASVIRYAAAGSAMPSNPQLAGRLVLTQQVPMIAAAAVRTEKGDLVYAYTYRDMAVQLVPMFGDTVWYLPNLEIANSPPLTLSGTLYSGGDLYLSGGGGTIDITSTAYAVGNMFLGRHPLRISGNGNNLNTVKLFNTRSGAMQTWPSDLNPSSSFNSSNLAAGAIPQSDWRTQFASRFGDGALANMPPMNLPGTPPGMNGRNYRDSGANGSRFLIEPGAALPATNDATYTARLQQEAQKLYHRANLRVVYDVRRTAAGAISGTPSVKAYKPTARDSRGLVTGWTEVALPSGVATISPVYKGGSVASENATIFDARRATSGYTGSSNGGHILTLDVDVAKLRNAVEEISGTTERFPTGTNRFNPASDWNGVVYFESANTRAGTGVRLLNGSRLPNRSASNPVGMTVATNDVLYVQGHYNADGNSSTGSAELADFMNSDGTPKAVTRAEWPAALIADAVNLLSPGFERKGTSVPNASVSLMEVSAAILSGIAPSTSTAYSGGLENFPRFLENWGSGRTVRYRGSMVCLFDSAVANERWGDSNVYSPPQRVWGFNRMYGQGELPPATPMAIVNNGNPPSNFRTFSKAEYAVEYNRLIGEIAALTSESLSTVEARFAPHTSDGKRKSAGPL